jgi:hypothetical protein
MLYNPWPARRKKILFAILAVSIVVLVAVIIFNIRQKKQPVRRNDMGEQGTGAGSAEEKQKAMLDAINKANGSGAGQAGGEPAGGQNKKQQEMKDTIGKNNSQTQPISREESAKRAEDMLNEMNKANKK